MIGFHLPSVPLQLIMAFGPKLTAKVDIRLPNPHHMSWVFDAGKICLNLIQPPQNLFCLDATNIVQV